MLVDIVDSSRAAWPASCKARLVFALIGVGLLATACIRKDYPAGRDIVSSVQIQGTSAVAEDALVEGLATAESPEFFGLWDGVVYDYEVFDETLLARDLERIERYYRAQGYYDAKVTAARVIRLDEQRVRVEIRVQEGPLTTVASVSPHGLSALPLEVTAAAIAAIRLDPGDPFDEARYEESKAGMRRALADRGYPFAEVEGQATVNLATRQAHVELRVTPGPRASFGNITIIGLEEIPESKVRSILQVEAGDLYSQTALQNAHDALTGLQIFSNVEIRQDRTKRKEAIVPLTLVMRESTLRTVRLGAGATADVLRVGVHARVGWEDRNFLGGMRNFSIDARPGLNFFPTRIDRLDAPTTLLPESRLRSELRQPSFIEGRVTGFATAEYNVIPLLYVPPDNVDPESVPIIGYQEVKASAGLERAFFSHRLLVTPSYNWVARFPFDYQGSSAEDLDPVVVSYPELYTSLDFRDSVIQPHSGALLSNSLQVAGYVFQGSVSDVRVRPEARVYVPIARKVTLATRTTFGFLFPADDPEDGGYGEAVQQENPDPEDPDVVRDQHKLLLRGFYSGGPNSNRGYRFRGVGPQGIIGFLVPTGVNCERLRDPETPKKDRDSIREACTRPSGGLTLWEASLEVRFPISGPVRGVVFADSSDVTKTVADIRFDAPHLSIGIGARYITPVGPFRVDLGYRVPGLARESQAERTSILGLPLALHIAIGEAY